MWKHFAVARFCPVNFLGCMPARSARCYLFLPMSVAWSVCPSICLSVWHVHMLSKNRPSEWELLWTVGALHQVGTPIGQFLLARHSVKCYQCRYWYTRVTPWVGGWVVTRMNCGKTDEAIEMLFGVQTRVDKRHIVLDGGPARPQGGGGPGGKCRTFNVQEVRCSNLETVRYDVGLSGGPIGKHP